MKKILMMLAAAMLLSLSASAQGMLGRLGQKAQEAAERAVGNRIENAIDRIDNAVGGGSGKSEKSGNDGGSSVSSTLKGAVSESLGGTYDSAPDNYYVTSLVEDADSEWSPSYAVTAEDGKEPSVKFATYSAAVAAMPALPAAKEFNTVAGKEAFAAKVLDFALAVGYMQADYVAAAGKLAGSGVQMMNQIGDVLGSDEVAGAMEVAAEWAKLPEAEAKKIEAMSEKDEAEALAYIKANHPSLYAKINSMTVSPAAAQKTQQKAENIINQDKADKYEEIGDKLRDIQQKKTEEMSSYITESMGAAARAALTGRQVLVGSSAAETELMQMRADILKSWAGSEEAAKVLKMEEELNKKTNDWMAQNKKTWNDELPSFWAEGRKAQNDVIDGFNLKQAEKWRALLQKQIDNQMVAVKEVTQLDDQLEAVRGKDEGDFTYWNCKMTAGLLSSTVVNCVLLHRMVLDLPLVNHVPEVNIQ